MSREAHLPDSPARLPMARVEGGRSTFLGRANGALGRGGALVGLWRRRGSRNGRILILAFLGYGAEACALLTR